MWQAGRDVTRCKGCNELEALSHMLIMQACFVRKFSGQFYFLIDLFIYVLIFIYLFIDIYLFLLFFTYKPNKREVPLAV